MTQAVAQRVKAHAVYHIAHEGLHKQFLGNRQRDAACLHVEQRFLVELAHSGTVRTLHVVGINFELGLGVHLGGGRCHYVAVALISVDFGTVGLDENLTGKSADSVVVEHIFEHLVALATWCVVID